MYSNSCVIKFEGNANTFFACEGTRETHQWVVFLILHLPHSSQAKHPLLWQGVSCGTCPCITGLSRSMPQLHGPSQLSTQHIVQLKPQALPPSFQAPMVTNEALALRFRQMPSLRQSCLLAEVITWFSPNTASLSISIHSPQVREAEV